MQAPSPPALDDPSLYLNRDLSWLEFNRRVLEEGCDPQVPLLERLKFLAIFTSNLDEFFMVRVAGIQQKVQAGLPVGTGADKTPPRLQLERIGQVVREMVARQYDCLLRELLPALEKEGITLRRPVDLSEKEQLYLRDLFQREIYPVLTPLAIDPGHPFPHLLTGSLNLAVRLHRPSDDEVLYAVVQVPSVLPRFVALPASNGHVYITLEALIQLHLSDLFRGMKLVDATTFQLTRNSDFEIAGGDEVEDLLRTIEVEIRKRRRGAAVRLCLAEDAPLQTEAFLKEAFDLDASDICRTPQPLDLTALFQIYSLPGYAHLRDPKAVPQPVAAFVQAGSPWEAIRAHDILVHHPYESFQHVVDFISEAARDERVLAIKQTLYRTGTDSPIVKALQRAANNGKQVTALVELKARMDEERNIAWARKLERAGVHVVFGFVGLKTHCKAALVVRREEDGIRRYVHLSSGNYNSQTGRLYTDIGLFTCNPAFAEDVSELFNYLTGYCQLPQWRKLVVAPSRLLSFMGESIRKETSNQLAGKRARIIAKINAVLEPEIIRELYRASQAGVKIDLICRGICALRPGLPGVSETIEVISIVDRFLEHSRIYYFENAGSPLVYVGSADWMDRNLRRRVEVVFPIEEPQLKQRVIDDLLPISLGDNVKARRLLPDGSYRRVVPEPGQERLRSQERFLELAALQNRVLPEEPMALPPMELNTPAPAKERARKRLKS
jgi:polyphosphate kinase